MNLFDLSGSVALVTGGNSGIGKGMALGLAEAGADIVIAARNEDRTAATVAEIEALGRRALGVRCDVAKREDLEAAVAAAFERFGAVDILVNNSGMSIRAAPQELSLAGWHAVMDVNLTAAFLLSQLCYPSMRERGRGKVINVASNYALFGGTWNFAYSTSKGGLVQFTRSLANAWAKDNIQVNAVLPGYIQTGLTERIASMPELYDWLIGQTPAGRPGQPADLAGAAVFLASRASDFITGASLIVDGGMAIADVATKFPLS